MEAQAEVESNVVAPARYTFELYTVNSFCTTCQSGKDPMQPPSEGSSI